MAEVTSELGNYLRLLRIKNSLTMTQTAKQTGITQGYISQIENGVYTPSAKTLAKLARAYNVPEIHLLRKAGVVQLSSAFSQQQQGLESTAGEDLDPLSDVADANELVAQIKRSLASLEYLTDQLRQRGQLANMPASEEEQSLTLGEQLQAEMNLPIYDSTWQPLQNAQGEAAGMVLPAYMCNDDPDAFILTVADESMAPLVSRGDWAVISPLTVPENGDLVAINDRNQIQLRHYYTTGEIVSLMPHHPDYMSKALVADRSDKAHQPEIVGRVLRIVNRVL
jgi:transcriptional regulator with XRE-family HTH domain